MNRSLCKWLVFGVSLVVAAVSYSEWANAAQVSASFGKDTGRGNLVGIQPWLTPAHYKTQEDFQNELGVLFGEASQQGWFGSKTIVTLPEDVGTWFVALGESSGVYNAQSMTNGIARMALGHLFEFISQIFKASSEDKLSEAALRLKSEQMFKAYQQTFSQLALQYKVTIVAGSIVLPRLEIDAQGKMQVSKTGGLYNTSVVFKPDGHPEAQTVRKVYPVVDEAGFTTAGKLDEIPVFETPAGKLAVLVCADSWYTESYASLKKRGVELITVPAYINQEGFSSSPWPGPNPVPVTQDFELSDVRKITGDQAWLKYTLPGRMALSGARAGMIVFLRGNYWQMGSDGAAIVVDRGKVLRGPSSSTASLVNLWL